MRILGLHIRDTKNAGDRWSSPLDYFQFPGHDAVLADMRSPPDSQPDVVVYGGGSIITSPDFRSWPGAAVVGWGVGHHERRWPWDDAMRDEHRHALTKCALYFPRDAVDGLTCVPCASCMHPVFDEEIPAPQYDVVRYSAARRVKVEDPPSAPHMSNEDGSIDDAVRFLASGRTVVTSSYHGAYWARLLGREVKIVPWGSKFFYLPTLNLEQCREANRRAHAAVLSLVNNIDPGTEAHAGLL